ncbi:MAG: hypothetical protein M3Y55_05615 [Pseudomonadota bacterium]|nr:hypothetical protein [Pseudomonadota bacterium]
MPATETESAIWQDLAQVRGGGGEGQMRRPFDLQVLQLRRDATRDDTIQWAERSAWALARATTVAHPKTVDGDPAEHGADLSLKPVLGAESSHADLTVCVRIGNAGALGTHEVLLCAGQQRPPLGQRKAQRARGQFPIYDARRTGSVVLKS